MGSIKNLKHIRVTPLRQIETTGGNVFHAMKSTDPGYQGFGEAYFSWIGQSAVKAWKRHLYMTMNLIVPVGRVRFVFAEKVDGTLRQEIIGPDHYARLTVPPDIWFGFQGLASNSLVLNLASLVHDPNEVERLPVSSFNYQWDEI